MMSDQDPQLSIWPWLSPRQTFIQSLLRSKRYFCFTAYTHYSLSSACSSRTVQHGLSPRSCQLAGRRHRLHFCRWSHHDLRTHRVVSLDLSLLLLPMQSLQEGRPLVHKIASGFDAPAIRYSAVCPIYVTWISLANTKIQGGILASHGGHLTTTTTSSRVPSTHRRGILPMVCLLHICCPVNSPMAHLRLPNCGLSIRPKEADQARPRRGHSPEGRGGHASLQRTSRVTI